MEPRTGEETEGRRGVRERGSAKEGRERAQRACSGGEMEGGVAGADDGRAVLINSQLFIPVILRGGDQERKRRRRRRRGGEVRRREMGVGGREATATAASMHRCSPSSPPLHRLPLHLTFPPVLQFEDVTHRWRLPYREETADAVSSY